ncbi:MAG: hydroxyisourate hydrolase [Candidatus Eremiobacteraeota bacterium]|nr:hydroxyisourate hydrolase [Candidatus Eremiobacteraeota bacterium]MBV8353818.1 hydroxyisourate hydrolase [Candidatus Eremiobacteraeota bacterium]
MTLTTHVLDLAGGQPAAGIEVVLFRIEGEKRSELARARTNQDGRTEEPLGAELEAGWYELVFHAGTYLSAAGLGSFYDQIPVRFRVDPGMTRYHVPLLLSPWGYSTYRGS